MTMPRRRLFSLLGASLAMPWEAAAERLRGPAPQRVVDVLTWVERVKRTGRYDHSTRIDLRAGRFDWDCSAMAGWVLARAAPQALAAVGGTRPVAAAFTRTIARAPTQPARGPWMRIPRVLDARPGDVLAWQRPRWFPSNNTGHVAFVRDVPVAHPLGALVRITDSTRYGHQDDSRDTEHGETGFGHGTLLVATNPLTGEGVGYGWIGAHTPQEWIIATPVVIGRVRG